MEAVRKFAQVVQTAFRQMPKHSLRATGGAHPVKVAIIDDGVNPSRLTHKGSLKGGWPLNPVAGHRKASPYYNSSEGHGTTMANLIHTVCPHADLYVAKLEKSPSSTYRSVAHMAAEVSLHPHLESVKLGSC